MATSKTKRVQGSCEVSYDENGQLVTSNFRAFKKKSQEERELSFTRVNEICSVHEHTYTFSIRLRVEKDKAISSRKFFESLGEALSLVESKLK